MRSNVVAVCDPIGAAAHVDLFHRLAVVKEHRKRQLSALVFDCHNESGTDLLGAGERFRCPDLKFDSRIAVALLAHRIRAAVFAAELGDHNLFQEARSQDFPLQHVVFTPDSFRVGVSQAVLDSKPPKLGETASFLLNTNSTRNPSAEKVELLKDSIEKVQVFGGATVLSVLGVVILMREREVFAQSNSWTTTSLDGTVYTDFVSDPIALGCEIIHESSHLWLNEVFAVCGFPFEDPETFFSPWKNTQRPRFGFLHAVFAFSMIACYCQAVLEAGANSGSGDFISMMLQKQQRNLESVRNELCRALSPLKNEISSIVIAAIETALGVRKAYASNNP